jgi:abortive infection bacteriophage resistance protein
MRDRQVADIIEKMKRQIRVNGQKHSATIHYLSNYGYIPLWILVKVLSFGITSELYTILKSDDQDEIASFYKLDSSTLSIYLTMLANYRNLCAHEDILFDHRTQKSIPDSKYHYLLKLPQIEEEYVYGKNDLFAIVLIFKHMLSRREFNSFVDEINNELSDLINNIRVLSPDVLLNKIGFPDNWLLLKDI